MTQGTQSVSGSLPKARSEYDQNHINLLIREIEDRFTLLDGFRFLRGNGMLLIGLQGNGSGLEVNRVYEENGFLKIVRDSDIFAPSLPLELSLGTVTVAIT